MNLIVDIGNSTSKAAVFDGTTLVARRRLGVHLADDLAMLASAYSIRACAWASVGPAHPEVTALLQQLSHDPLEIKGTTPTPLTCDYQTPATLGADRLAAAVGAATLHPATDLLIIDAGTCITYDYVTADGHYLGGNISPGLGMRLRALQQQTARLPLVSADGPLPEVGCDTSTAIRAGIIRGMNFEITGYAGDFKAKHPDGHLYLTGGNAPRFAPHLEAELCDTLVETGINQILLYNRR